MGRKFRGRTGSPSNTKSPGPRPSCIPSDILIHAAIWPQQIWVKNWGLCPFGVGGAGSPSNAMWPGPRPTCVPSFILIRPTVWPQYTNITGRTDRQRSDSIGRSVLQMVAQKLTCFRGMNPQPHHNGAISLYLYLLLQPWRIGHVDVLSDQLSSS